MSHMRTTTEADASIMKFYTAEEAWFWFIRCDVARAEGARPGDGPRHTERPCSPDDMYRWLKELYDDGALLASHVWVLAHYGVLDREPDPEFPAEFFDWVIWVDAFDFLEALLRDKGAIE